MFVDSRYFPDQEIFNRHLADVRVLSGEACDCPIDCQVILTVKVQKSMKSIVRVVHLPSVVESEFYNATEYFLYANKLK